MDAIVMKIISVMIALLFIISPIMAGAFAMLACNRKRIIRKLMDKIDELNAENRELRYGEEMVEPATEEPAGVFDQVKSAYRPIRRKRKRSRSGRKATDKAQDGFSAQS